MEEFYRLNPVISCTNEVVGIENVNSSAVPSIFQNNSVSDHNGMYFRFETEIMEPDMSDLIKTQIANHPRYPDLVAAYIECQKVGAPPETASHLEEISRDNFSVSRCSEFGVDPELDDFMESYCEILHRYKEELSKPFNEATAFLSSIESEFCKLCSESSTKTLDYHSADQEAAEEEEYISSCGEVEVSESEEQDNSLGVRSGDQELKEMLLRKYSGYLNSLRKEFLHKRKKGKLPKDATTSLMDWWNSHYRWPYPTEEEKQKLSEETGLDQKQINNWFINQRKRHWKPSEEMRTALTQSVRNAINGGGGGAGPFYFDTGIGSDHHDF